MVSIVPIERKSPVLVPSSMACLNRMPTINLTAGCAHECLYCYAQGYCSYPGTGNVRVYTNVLEKLRRELARKRKMPEAVCFSTSSDPFQPLPEVLDLAYDVLKFLLEQNIGVVLLTKGRIPNRHLELLTAHAALVQVQIGLITLDRELLRLVEPCTASPRRRLEQVRQLVEGGVSTQARMDPILPGLTDGPDTLHALCAALAAAGVKEIAAGTLFLRPALVRELRNHPKRPALFRKLLSHYARAPWMAIQAGSSSVLALPAWQRRKTFDWLTTIARQYALTVHVCACKNPDLATGSCHLAGRWSAPVVLERQLDLFGAPCPPRAATPTMG